MNDWQHALGLPCLDRPDYVPPPPRRAVLNRRALGLRFGLLAALVMGPPLVLSLGQVAGEKLERLAHEGRWTTAVLVPHG